MSEDNTTITPLAENEDSEIWLEETDGEKIYNIQIGMVTVHFLAEEWKEFVAIVAEANKADKK